MFDQKSQKKIRAIGKVLGVLLTFSMLILYSAPMLF